MKGCKMTTKKDEKQDGQSIDELFNTAQPKVKVDPNTGLIASSSGSST